jgi:hypothetical protein
MRSAQTGSRPQRIAKALNERRIPTTRGGRWQAVQVQRMLRKRPV